jgi:hypothetical protein
VPGRGVLLLLPIGDVGSPGDARTMVRRLFDHRASLPDDDIVGQTAQVADMIGQSRSIRCERYAIASSPPEPGEIIQDACLNFAFIKNPVNQSTFRRAAIVDGSFLHLAGVRLRAARVTITREPVTRRIDRILPWLPEAQAYWAHRLTTDEDRQFFDREIIYMKQ